MSVLFQLNPLQTTNFAFIKPTNMQKLFGSVTKQNSGCCLKDGMMKIQAKYQNQMKFNNFYSNLITIIGIVQMLLHLRR